VLEKEIEGELSEEKLRKTYEALKNVGSVEAEDENEIRIAMYDALQSEETVSMEEWDKILAREFNTFKEGEKYDYVTDLRRTFDESVSTPLEQKIFKKIPSHFFWDIKKPLGVREEVPINPYNPARKYPFESFFDMRRHQEWLKTKEENRNIACGVSQHNRI